MTKHDTPVVLLPGAAPTGPTHATPKSYVDTRAAPAGGTLGQALTKNSSTDYDYSWVAIGGGSPSGAAGGSLAGTYPNPTIAAGVIDGAAIASAIKDAAAATASLRTLGTGPTQAAAGNDGRLTDARTPLAHASSHASGGSDAITPAAIGAAPRLTVTAVKTADYTAVAGDYVLVDASGASRTVTLPAAAVGLAIGVRKTDTSANTVTVAPNGSDTFQGGASANPVIRIQDGSRTLIGVSGGWVTMEQYRAATTTTDGAIVLAGDLGGTAVSPTVPGLAGKQASSAHLSAISGLTPVANDTLQYKAGAWANRTMAQLKSDLALVAGDITSGTFAIGQIPTGTTSTTVPLGNDARLSDARTPTAHASSHAVGGGDVLTPSAIGAFPKLTPTANKTSAYTAVDGDLVMCDDTGGSFTVTLPAATLGRVVGIKKLASSSNTVTISRAGTDTIGAAAATSVSVKLTDETTTLQCSATGVWTPVWNWISLPGMDARYGRLSGATTWTAVQTFSTAIINTPVVLTDAATVAINAALGNHFRLTATSGIGATRALGAPTNAADGQKILIEYVQDGTGSRALTFNAIYNFGTDVASPTLSTAASKRDYMGFVYNGTSSKWDLIAVARGY
jgi:hypothetical protein